MLEHPSDPLDAARLPRLTVFGVPWCEDTAITRSRLQALTVPFLYVDLEDDPKADAYVRELHRGHRITPTVVVGVEEEVAAEPDLATVDRLAALAWPGLPIERPTLSRVPAGELAEPGSAEPRAVTPHGLIDVPAAGETERITSDPALPVPWTKGEARRETVVMLAHGGGCLACLGYAKRLLAEREAFAAARAGAVVVVADDSSAVATWRADLPEAARVLADPDGRWRARTLGRLIADAGIPGSTIRYAEDGVALLVVDRHGQVIRMAAGPEAGDLPDPAYLADAVAMEDARAGLGIDG